MRPDLADDARSWEMSKACHSQSGNILEGPRSLTLRSIHFSPTNTTDLIYDFGLQGFDLLYIGPTY
jgi:hypothetical protein